MSIWNLFEAVVEMLCCFFKNQGSISDCGVIVLARSRNGDRRFSPCFAFKYDCNIVTDACIDDNNRIVLSECMKQTQNNICSTSCIYDHM